MARMTRAEAADRVKQHVEDALSRLDKKDWGGARDFLEAGRAQTAAIIATPVKARKVPEVSMKDNKYSQSLVLGLAILSCFPGEPGDEVWGIADIADKLNASRSTVHRYMITLVQVGQLEQTVGRKYRRPDIED